MLANNTVSLHVRGRQVFVATCGYENCTTPEAIKHRVYCLCNAVLGFIVGLNVVHRTGDHAYAICCLRLLVTLLARIALNALMKGDWPIRAP